MNIEWGSMWCSKEQEKLSNTGWEGRVHTCKFTKIEAEI